MSRVLVIEPQKILQQAIIFSLFPEHDVELSIDFSEKTTAVDRNFDLVIVDAAALRDKNALGGLWLGSVQNWKVPMIWIQDGGSPPILNGGAMVVLQRPLQKHALQLAVIECLSAASTSRPAGPGVPDKGSPGFSKASTVETGTAIASELPARRVIELVEVVEEEAEDKANMTRQRKTK
jgi:hypothetical protein